MAGWFPENSCKSWQLRQRDRVVVVREPIDLCDLLEMWAERKGGRSRWSVTEPGMRLGDREGVKVVILFPWSAWLVGSQGIPLRVSLGEMTGAGPAPIFSEKMASKGRELYRACGKITC